MYRNKEAIARLLLALCQCRHLSVKPCTPQPPNRQAKCKARGVEMQLSRVFAGVAIRQVRFLGPGVTCELRL